MYTWDVFSSCTHGDHAYKKQKHEKKACANFRNFWNFFETQRAEPLLGLLPLGPRTMYHINRTQERYEHFPFFVCLECKHCCDLAPTFVEQCLTPYIC